jgi:hypothetical protein
MVLAVEEEEMSEAWSLCSGSLQVHRKDEEVYSNATSVG